MTALFVFALTLLAAVLVSDLADRSVLSTAVLFLLAGVVAGEGLLGAVSLRPGRPGGRPPRRAGAVQRPVHRRDAGGAEGPRLRLDACRVGPSCSACR